MKNFMEKAKEIIAQYKCPYCNTAYQFLADAQRCHGMCYIASLLDKIFPNDGWNPPPISEFQTWKSGDRKELARRVDQFAQMYYNFEPPTIK